MESAQLELYRLEMERELGVALDLHLMETGLVGAAWVLESGACKAYVPPQPSDMKRLRQDEEEQVSCLELAEHMKKLVVPQSSKRLRLVSR